MRWVGVPEWPALLEDVVGLEIVSAGSVGDGERLCFRR